MTRRPIRLPRDGEPMLDIFSLGRVGSSERFTSSQIEQIRRTVGRTPEVMVKVTGGGAKVGTVAAHLTYISRKGELEIETDEGTLIGNKDEQKALLREWHLELSAGQYRGRRDGHSKARTTKLVHNVVLSMPTPTPPDKVLAAARKFARDGAAHRPAAPTRAHGRQSRERARPTVAYRQGNAASMARGFRADDERAGGRC